MRLTLPHKDFWNVFKKTPGALSVCESIAIMNVAALAPYGRAIELGTFKGKSAMSALQQLDADEFIMLEPDFVTGKINSMEVWETLNEATMKSEKVKLCFLGEYSIDVIPRYENFSYVMVDSGSHQDGLPMTEAKLLEDRLVKGGVVVWHDWNSQFLEVKEASDYLVSTGKYEYIHIPWNEIVDYVRANNLEHNGNDSWHHPETEFPCFVGAIRKK
jgi:hypothetical protein